MDEIGLSRRADIGAEMNPLVRAPHEVGMAAKVGVDAEKADLVAAAGSR
jgi:hypothetical protein